MHSNRGSTIVTLVLVALTVLAFGLISNRPALAAPPLNDDVANSYMIDYLTFAQTLDTSEATTEATDPADCGGAAASVWYAFTAWADMRLEVTTFGGYYATSYDHSVAVYTGSPGAFTPVACLPSALNQPLAFDATFMATYYIMVGSNTGSGGNLYFSLRDVPAFPANDDIANAIDINGPPYGPDYSDTRSTTYATIAPDDPWDCFVPYASVWYAFTPYHHVLVELNTLGSGYDAAITVYRGQPGALSLVTCGSPAVTLDAISGVTYYFLVSDTGSSGQSTGGDLVFNLVGIPGPLENDDFDTPTVIAELPFFDSMETTLATWSSDDPLGCGGEAASVWYAYTPPVTTWLETDTYGETTDIGLSVYTGTRGHLALVACQTDWNTGESLRFEAQGGTTYYFMLSPLIAQTHVALNLREAPPPPPANDTYANAAGVGALPYTDWLNTTSATSTDDPWPCDEPLATVWYAYTPDRSIRLQANTYGSDYTTTLAVFSGPPDSGNAIACGMNEVTVDITAGQIYYIMVGSAWWYWPSGGNLVFNLVELPGPPPNDNFDSATVVGELPFSEAVDASQAARAGDDPYSSCGGWDRTVWYAFTPAETMWLEADDAGTFYTVVSVYTGARGSLTEIACRSDWYMGEPLRFLAEGGTTYYFMVSPSWDISTWVALNLRAGPMPPPNDDIANATAIGELPFTESIDGRYASWSGSDPGCASGYPTVWYSFTAPEDMRLQAAVDDYGAWSVYSGAPGSLTQLACVFYDGYPMPVVMPVQGGQTVYIMVSVAPYYDQQLTFTLSEAPPPLAIDVTVDSTGTFARDGSATISGTVTCSRQSQGYIQVYLRQPVGRVNIVQNGKFVEFACDATTQRWSVTIAPYNGRFAGGQAQVTLDAYVQSGYESATAHAIADVTLNRAPR